MPPRRNPERSTQSQKKTKVSHDGEASPSIPPPQPTSGILPPPSPTTIRWFKSESHRLKYETKFLNRIVAKGKIVSLSECESLNLNTYALFDAIGLGDFVSMDIPFYPKLVRLFFAHLIVVADAAVSTLYSFVAGADIILDVASIQRLLNLPEGGIQYFMSHVWYDGADFNPLEAVRQMSFDKTTTNILKVKSSQLTVEARLVYNIIMYTILPKSGGRSDVSYMEAFLIWCVLNGRKFDLSFLIFHHLLDCKKSGVHLYYAMPLTRIFLAKGVPVGSCNSATHGLRDRLNITMLKMMKLRQNEGRQWYDPKLIEGMVGVNEDSDDEEEELGSHEHEETEVQMSAQSSRDRSFPFPPDLRAMIVENLAIAKDNRTKLDELTKKVDALASSSIKQAEITELSDRIEELAGEVGSHTENLSDLRHGLDLPPF